MPLTLVTSFQLYQLPAYPVIYQGQGDFPIGLRQNGYTFEQATGKTYCPKFVGQCAKNPFLVTDNVAIFGGDSLINTFLVNASIFCSPYLPHLGFYLVFP